MDTSVYDMRTNIDKELERLERSDISDLSKEAIKEFLDSVTVKEVTNHRIYFYAVRLRLLADFMKDDFLNPNVKSVTRLITTLKSIDSRRHSPYSTNTLNDFKIALKRFWIWKFKTIDPEIQEILKKRESKSNKRSEDIITQAEVRDIISHTNSPRDKFLIALAYDSGCRISELLTLRIRDVKIDDYGIKLHVTGKTGERTVRCVGDSVALFNDWILRHPNRENKDAYLFVKFASGSFKGGGSLDYITASKMLETAVKRSGINRRIHFHLFRHTRATLLSRDVKEAPLESQMGWIHGSKQTQTYVHLSDQDVDNSILKAYGIEIKENHKMRIDELPRVCERCGTINTSDATYCKRCALPLDKKTLMNIEEKENKAISILDNVSLDPIESKLLEMIHSHPELKEQLLLELLKMRKEKG